MEKYYLDSDGFLCVEENGSVRKLFKVETTAEAPARKVVREGGVEFVFEKIGRTVTCMISTISNTPLGPWEQKTICHIPDGFLPYKNAYFPVAYQVDNYLPIALAVKDDNTIKLFNQCGHNNNSGSISAPCLTWVTRG